ncbi:tetraspanin Tsp3 [Tricladium varicosporioides]|nr:tetraspanin Tsp3 [Hymenoscyphus varicosporioides]
MASSLPKFLLLAGPIILLVLTGIAGYAFSQIRFLHLPVPQALALFTIVLPFITGISTQGVYNFIQRSSRSEPYRLAIPLVVVIGFQLIYETIVATLALTHMIPPANLSCGLNDQWQKMFREKNEEAIKAIQDSFNCCGFNSVVDRAYPFPKNAASDCATRYERNKSCFGQWRKAEQVNAGLLLLVALLVFIVKAGSIISLLSSNTWTTARWTRHFKRLASEPHHDEEDNRTTTRGLIEANIQEEPYTDNPSDTTATPAIANGSHSQGPRVEPSQLGDDHNEWREERSQEQAH